MKKLIFLLLLLPIASFGQKIDTVRTEINIPPTLEAMLINNDNKSVELGKQLEELKEQNKKLLIIILELKGIKQEDVIGSEYKPGVLTVKTKKK